MRRRLPLAATLLLAVLAAGCTASTRQAPPVVVEPGADVGSAWLPSLAVRSDGGFDAHAVGVPGGTLRMADAFHVTNRGASALLVAVAPREASPVWSVGLGKSAATQAALAPGETLVGQLVLALPETGAASFRAEFDLQILIPE